MTPDEMSAAFDLKYNNIMSNLAPGLNEYEKSYFLTQAQKNLLQTLVSSYEANPSVEYTFRHLIKYSDTEVADVISTHQLSSDYHKAYAPMSDTPLTPTTAFKVLYEEAVCEPDGDTGILSVIPISYSELSRISKNAYPFPALHTCWRVGGSAINTTGSRDMAMYIPPLGVEITQIRYHYVCYPDPIILVNLGNTTSHEVQIDEMWLKAATGSATASTGQPHSKNWLHPSFHEAIVDSAVMSAKAAMSGQGVIPTGGGDSSQKQSEE
jgi:hypothetical protein